VTQTRTASPIRTTLSPAIISTTVTRTITTALTIAPHASTTSTFLTTITTISTATTTQITTLTSTEIDTISSIVTSYDACATSNFLGPLPDGSMIDNIYNNGIGQPSTFSVQPASSQYDCCVTCITNSICTGSAFYISQGLCILLQNSAGTCGAQASSSGFYVYEPAGSVSVSFTVSNGNCGFLYSGGLGI
jgi:hypothetical protein